MKKAKDLDELIATPQQRPIFPPPYQNGRWIIWITGDKGSGKSTAAAGLDKVAPGRPANTLVLDLENSYATLSGEYSLAVYNTLQTEADEKYAKVEDPGERLFMAYLDFVAQVKAGEFSQYRTLVLDTADKLFMGSNAWVRKNPTKFGKHPGQFNGEKGTIFSFGPTREWWEDHAIELTEYFQAVVMVSHIGDKWEQNVRVGLKIKGASFERAASLKIWMHKPDPKTNEPGIARGARWAEIQKDRFTWVYWPTLGDLRADGVIDKLVAEGVIAIDEVVAEDDERLAEYMNERPMPVLPRKFEVAGGETVFNIIRNYMRAPKRDYGAFNLVENAGDDMRLTDDERLQIEGQKAQAEAEKVQAEFALSLSAAKTEMAKRLRAHGYQLVDIKPAMDRLGLEIRTLEDVELVEQALVSERENVNA